MNKKTKILDLFYDILRKNDIKKIFGNPGTTELSLLNGINDNKDFEYILTLQESSAVGIAAGYAAGTNMPAFVNLHTYCGLANGMCNIFNALQSQIPLVITAGQQNRKMLSFNPTLSGPLTELAKSAVKNVYQVNQNYDLALLLQRSINIANQYPKGPTFLALPMDIFHEEIDFYHDIGLPSNTYVGDVPIKEFEKLINDLKFNKKKICLILDQESKDSFKEIHTLAESLIADVYNSAYVNFQVFDTSHPLFKGTIPSSFIGQNKLLSNYDIAIIIGKKLCCFLPSEENSVPDTCTIVHINNTLDELHFNFKTDHSFIGDIKDSINNFIIALKNLKIDVQNKEKLKNIKTKTLKKEDFSDKFQVKEGEALNPKGIIYYALQAFPNKYSIVVEPSSEMYYVSNLTKHKLPNTIFYAHRGAGLGWAMPFSIGLSMAKNEPVLCFIGDGGSLYAIQCIYTALIKKVPIIFVCFENRSYHILKELGLLENPDYINRFVGLDFKEKELDLLKIAEGFGALSYIANSYEKLQELIKSNLNSDKPIWISVPTNSKLKTMFN